MKLDKDMISKTKTTAFWIHLTLDANFRRFFFFWDANFCSETLTLDAEFLKDANQQLLALSEVSSQMSIMIHSPDYGCQFGAKKFSQDCGRSSSDVRIKKLIGKELGKNMKKRPLISFLKFFWTIFCLVGAIYHSLVMTQQYLGYETVTSTTISTPNVFAPPAVSVCVPLFRIMNQTLICR